MKSLATSVVAAVLLILIVIATVFYQQSNPRTDNSNPVSKPDQYTFNATLYAYDEQGLVGSILHARKLVHFQDNNTTALTDPDMTTYTDKRQAWHIRAQHGLMQHGIEVVHLWGDVVITQQGSAQQTQTTIQTTQITYHPKTAVLETDRQVKVARPGMTLNAQGMTANLKQGVIKTTSHSRGEYDPVGAR